MVTLVLTPVEEWLGQIGGVCEFFKILGIFVESVRSVEFYVELCYM